MGTKQQVLFFFLGHLFAAQSFRRHEDAMLPQDFEGFFDNNWPFPADKSFDFPAFNTFFSSWRSWTPDFLMASEFPPVMNVPRVQVFCDETKLTLLVDKKTFGQMLTADEIQLGDGCYSNKELPDQFIFVYGLDQCGTTPVLQDGQQIFTNSLHLNLKKSLPVWWQTPSTIHISCIPKRLYTESNLVSASVNVKSFAIQAMNSSWTNAAESNIYKRGQEVHLQVSANTRAHEQLYIHSCFVSASPEFQTKPRHPIILNKGCVSSLGSPHTVARFAAAENEGVVNFVVNTSHLISEFYVHCSVVISTPRVTSASKSCNYNVTKSRWEELNGDMKVCSCCSSKCKGPSVKNLSDDAKALVSIGPLVIEDDDMEMSPALPESEPQTFSSSLPTTMRSDTPSPTEDVIASAASLSGSELPSAHQGVLVMSQDQDARLTLWLPGQVQAESDKVISPMEGFPVLSRSSHQGEPDQQLSAADGPSPLSSPSNEIPGPTKNKLESPFWDMTFVTLVDGQQSPSHDNEVIAGIFPRKNRFGRSGKLVTDATQTANSLPSEINVNLLFENPKPAAPEEESQWPIADLTESNKGDGLSEMEEAGEPEADIQPVIRMKLEFSKSADGSKKLSYEEEVKQKEVKLPQEKLKPRRKGLHSTFLNLLRKMDKAE